MVFCFRTSDDLPENFCTSGEDRTTMSPLGPSALPPYFPPATAASRTSSTHKDKGSPQRQRQPQRRGVALAWVVRSVDRMLSRSPHPLVTSPPHSLPQSPIPSLPTILLPPTTYSSLPTILLPSLPFSLPTYLPTYLSYLWSNLI